MILLAKEMLPTFLSIGIQTFTVLIGILLSRSDINILRSELRSEILELEQNLRGEIAASRKQSHDDIMILVGIAREHEGRITRLEARS